jgi:hypothetical protein
MITVRLLNDPNLLITDGEVKAIIYDPREAKTLYSFPVYPDTGSRVDADVELDRCLVGGWANRLVCRSLSTGETLWTEKRIFQMSSLEMFSKGNLAIVSGLDTQPRCGALVCDLDTGDFVPLSWSDRPVFRRILDPNVAFEFDQTGEEDFDSHRALWICRRRDSNEVMKFWGPRSLVAHAFSKRAIMMAGLNGSCMMFDFRAGECHTELLREYDGVAVGGLCYSARRECFVLVVQTDDRLESMVVEIDERTRRCRTLCSIKDYAAGAFFGAGEFLFSEAGIIYDAAKGKKLKSVKLKDLR